jgi:hypothetical protein
MLLNKYKNRLQALEKIAMEQEDYAIWFDMTDRKVLELVPDRKIRWEQNFPLVYNAATYVQNCVNDSGLTGGNIFLSDICELFSASRDTGDLGKKVAYLMKGEKISVFFGLRKTSEIYNLRLSAIASAIRSNFNNNQFLECCRKEEDWDEKHSRLFAALFEMYKFIKPSGNEQTMLENFGELFVQSSRLDRVIAEHLNNMPIPDLN